MTQQELDAIKDKLNEVCEDADALAYRLIKLRDIVKEIRIEGEI